MSTRIAPFGSWRSPITAAAIAEGTHAVESALFVGDEIWWSERRPTEGGRTGVFRHTAAGDVEAILPAPSGARSRVHEYGGGAWTATPEGALVYVEARDQRMRLLVPGADSKVLTPAVAGMSYGELSVRGREVIAVREHVSEHGVSRDIVAVPLDGAAANDLGAIRSVVSGSDFVAYPRFSPNGRMLAWIAWNHPRMPWEGTELRVGELGDDGAVTAWRALLGGPHESVLQPEWRDDRSLWCVSDASGFWNPVTVDVHGQQIGDGRTAPTAVDRETGGPLWNLGARWYLPLEDDRLLLRTTFGSDRLEVTDRDGSRRIVDTPFTSIDFLDRRGTEVLLHAGGGTLAGGLQRLDLATGRYETIRSDFDALPDPSYLPEPEERVFRGPDREVHAVVYPPRNPDFSAPEGELATYVTIVHGGPTAHSQASVNPVFAFYTSRGIGVLDVNYGGSTGYGRAYRERLDGQWGIVDVEDVETAARGLAAAGEADGQRLAIEGSSAGGWTVLSSLARGRVFAGGVSLYGVADLRSLVAVTHDFERSYLDGLVGPLPEAEAVYLERSPLTGAGTLRPILILQGLDDPVVPPAQAEQLRDALVAGGVPHAYLTFEGESHGFRRAETRTKVREAAVSFYGQLFGFEPADIPALPLWRPDQGNRSE